MERDRHTLGVVALLTVAEVIVADLKSAMTYPEKIKTAPTAEATVAMVDESIAVLAKLGENFALFSATYGATCNGIAEQREQEIIAEQKMPWWRKGW